MKFTKLHVISSLSEKRVFPLAVLAVFIGYIVAAAYHYNLHIDEE